MKVYVDYSTEEDELWLEANVVHSFKQLTLFGEEQTVLTVQYSDGSLEDVPMERTVVIPDESSHTEDLEAVL